VLVWVITASRAWASLRKGSSDAIRSSGGADARRGQPGPCPFARIPRRSSGGRRRGPTRATALVRGCSSGRTPAHRCRGGAGPAATNTACRSCLLVRVGARNSAHAADLRRSVQLHRRLSLMRHRTSPEPCDGPHEPHTLPAGPTPRPRPLPFASNAAERILRMYYAATTRSLRADYGRSRDSQATSPWPELSSLRYRHARLDYYAAATRTERAPLTPLPRDKCYSRAEAMALIRLLAPHRMNLEVRPVCEAPPGSRPRPQRRRRATRPAAAIADGDLRRAHVQEVAATLMALTSEGASLVRPVDEASQGQAMPPG
jgi:hypothetical protein